MFHPAETCPCDLLFSWWNRVHLDGHTTVHVSIHAVMDIWDFFQVLAVRKTALNIGQKV